MGTEPQLHFAVAIREGFCRLIRIIVFVSLARGNAFNIETIMFTYATTTYYIIYTYEIDLKLQQNGEIEPG